MLLPGETLRLGDIFLVAFVTAALAAYPIYRLLIAWKSRQTVSQYAPEGHQKKQGTPTMGGLILLPGVIAGMAAHLALGDPVKGTAGPSLAEVRGYPSPVLVALILFVGFALIGFIDDFVIPRMIAGKRGLGWKQKIAMQILLSVAAIGYLHSWKFGAETWAGVFLVLFFSNAYNFGDGLDGLAGSLLIGLGLGLAALAVHGGASLEVIIILAALMGAILPFLYMNAPPAKVFMGDVGALSIGACLGLVVYLLLTSREWVAYSLFPDTGGPFVPEVVREGPIQGPMAIAILIVSFIMIAELLPVPLQILSVKLRKKKLFPMTPIHHAFEAKGWPESRVVWTFAITQLVLSGAALYVYLRLVEAKG